VVDDVQKSAFFTLRSSISGHGLQMKDVSQPQIASLVQAFPNLDCRFGKTTSSFLLICASALDLETGTVSLQQGLEEPVMIAVPR